MALFVEENVIKGFIFIQFKKTLKKDKSQGKFHVFTSPNEGHNLPSGLRNNLPSGLRKKLVEGNMKMVKNLGEKRVKGKT